RRAAERHQGEEEGEEGEELVVAAVLIQKEIQPKLGSIVIQRFEYFVIWFGAVVLWLGAVVLWCLSLFQTLRQNDEQKVKCVDTASSGVDTKPSSQRTQLTGLYSVSTQPQVVCVDTSGPSQRTNSASLGQYVDTLLGQVDTLRKLFHFKFHLDMWHSRVHMDPSWIMCPCTPRVLLDTLGYKYPPIGHPTQENLFIAFQKSFWRQEEFSSLFLLLLCCCNQILISPSTRSED
ncbi:hypothetical protein Taro_000747, partial [Colocasia esculenta]|nr:hypothetical protein [Colocasia esculenta]